MEKSTAATTDQNVYREYRIVKSAVCSAAAAALSCAIAAASWDRQAFSGLMRHYLRSVLSAAAFPPAFAFITFCITRLTIS
jgi:hypothetical protein